MLGSKNAPILFNHHHHYHKLLMRGILLMLLPNIKLKGHLSGLNLRNK